MATTLEFVSEVLATTAVSTLFPRHLELVPQLNEVYELELAFLENRILNDEDLVRNGAYFARVGDTLTRHFLMCSGEPVRLPQHSSSRLRSFFQSNQFKTGYATHGLFPYRGKFHPQMVKGLINVMGLRPGETVLDPMMGSGTVLIEARLMGINSFGVDASPFCRFMAQAKLDALTMPLEPIREALAQSRALFSYFVGIAGQPKQGTKKKSDRRLGLLYEEMSLEATKEPSTPYETHESAAVRNFLLLAYLDSAGYSERSDRKAPYEQFKAILERYLFVAEKIQKVLEGAEAELGEAGALEGDARRLSIASESVDGILFSPPYSFAIDYLENDSFHLNYMGVDVDELRKCMVGLRGLALREKYELYEQDMGNVLAECARVLRRGRICTVVVGTNNNQLSKILGVPPEEVRGIEQMIAELGRDRGLKLVRKIERQITGMANSLRSEYILLLQRI